MPPEKYGLTALTLLLILPQSATAGRSFPMALEKLLDKAGRERFLRDHFLKLPFAQPGGCRSLAQLGTWETLEGILGQDDVDVLVVRQGQRWSGSRAPSYREARELFDEGYTVLVRHAERHDERLAALASSFREDFCGGVDVHLYCTPGESFGFGWHYDAEEVFILQTTGLKTYSLRKNTVHPWPLVETLPADMQYERELMPLSRCRLAAGDWLYIPGGYWHRAEASEDAISLAVGVMSTVALDLFDFLRRKLPDSIRWRQRFFPPGKASQLTDAELVALYRDIAEDLGRDLAAQLTNESVLAEFIEDRRRERND